MEWGWGRHRPVPHFCQPTSLLHFHLPACVGHGVGGCLGNQDAHTFVSLHPRDPPPRLQVLETVQGFGDVGYVYSRLARLTAKVEPAARGGATP
eukprot:365374-Chlamydomonas_euryale.AAC.3